MKLKTLAIAALLVSTAYAAERMATEYKVSKLSASEVGVSCNSGTMPKVTEIGQTLVIECK